MKSATRSKKFKKGQWKQARTILAYDLEGMMDSFLSKNKDDFLYHYRLLKGNLEDLYNIKHLAEERD
jgi:hypothetical protein